MAFKRGFPGGFAENATGATKIDSIWSCSAPLKVAASRKALGLLCLSRGLALRQLLLEKTRNRCSAAHLQVCSFPLYEAGGACCLARPHALCRRALLRRHRHSLRQRRRSSAARKHSVSKNGTCNFVELDAQNGASDARRAFHERPLSDVFETQVGAPPTAAAGRFFLGGVQRLVSKVGRDLETCARTRSCGFPSPEHSRSFPTWDERSVDTSPRT